MSDEVLQDYEAEQEDLRSVLVGLSADEWRLPTPAAGWDVRDQVSHLADTEDVAHDTMTDGPRTINVDAAQYGSAEGFTEAGCERGRSMAPAEVLEWWWTAAARVRSTMAALDRSARVPWGLGMGWQAFVTARLMEHWAHGLDIRAAVGRPGVDTDRLRHVAWISTRAVPYALRVAGLEAPEGHTLRFALVSPGRSEEWAFGPDDATDVITGPAAQWCRLAVQRITRAEAPDLQGEGPLAELALGHARAFL
ncbi:MAG TPA: maleylpyruvate isomerase family mycothiol-dependent enzyme [Acidimicrobiales bacterium]|nr:maleylpyruvate isomerase family mycothiol-dependent enzyme [Acidimicrobiales bacterium]